MKGFQPKKLWGRDNPFYKGASRADDARKMTVRDLETIASDFADVTDAAAHAILVKDEESYNELRTRAIQIYSAYQEYEHLVGSVDTRKRKFAEWNQSYLEFRHSCGLDQDRSGRPALVNIYSYKRDADSQYYRDVVAVIHQTARDMSNKEANYTRIYNQVAAGVASSTSSENQDSQYAGNDEATTVIPTVHTESSGSGGGKGAGPNSPSVGSPEPEPESSHSDRWESGISSDEDRPRPPRKKMKKNIFEKMFSGVESKTGLSNHGQFRVTSRPRIGPFVLNLGRGGLTSVSLKAGPMRYMIWSRKYRPGFSSMDLPSGLSFRGKRQNK